VDTRQKTAVVVQTVLKNDLQLHFNCSLYILSA